MISVLLKKYVRIPIIYVRNILFTFSKNTTKYIYVFQCSTKTVNG